MITRIGNSCALVELPGLTVLTDPWFREPWHLHRGEPLGLAADRLPPLDAVVVSNAFVNHFDPASLVAAGLDPLTIVPDARCATKARKAGLTDVLVAGWGDRVPVAGGGVDIVAAQRTMGRPANSYALSSGGVRVFFGGEARDVEPLRQWRATAAPVDVALLPANGLKVLGGPRLVMAPAAAVDAARVLGARWLVPIHDAVGRDVVWWLVRRHGTAADVVCLAGADPAVVDLPTGARWEPEPVA